MIVNGMALVRRAPLSPMVRTKRQAHGLSHGLSEVGYDLQVKQSIEWVPPDPFKAMEMYERRKSARFDMEAFLRAFHGHTIVTGDSGRVVKLGRTALASSIQRFRIPKDLWCEFRNKSSHARRFTDATIGTDGEPGWSGHLTIEVIFHDHEPIRIPAGAGVLKAVFHQLMVKADYGAGRRKKYQNQPDRPVAAIFEENR